MIMEPCPRRCRRLRPMLSLSLALPVAAALMMSPRDAGAAVSASGIAPLADGELAGLRGGFNVGGFDLSLGVVARTVVDRATAGAGERLEVVTRFSVPEPGRMVTLGATVRPLAPGDAGEALAPGGVGLDGVSLSTTGGATRVDIGGTTRLTHHMLNTVVENSDLDRVIANQLDINLTLGGVGRRVNALRAARALRPAIDAQILYRGR